MFEKVWIAIIAGIVLACLCMAARGDTVAIDLDDDDSITLGADTDGTLIYDSGDDRVELRGSKDFWVQDDLVVGGAFTLVSTFSMADDQALIFGDDSDIQVLYDETADNRLEFSDGTNLLAWLTDAGTTGTFGVTEDINILDDKALVVGTNSDIQYGYDETGDDRAEWTDGTNLLAYLTDSGTTGDFGITGNLDIDGTTNLDDDVTLSDQNADGAAYVKITNTNGGTNARSQIWMYNDGSTGQATFGLAGTGYTTVAALQDRQYMYADTGTSGQVFYCAANAATTFYNNSALGMTLEADHDLICEADIQAKGNDIRDQGGTWISSDGSQNGTVHGTWTVNDGTSYVYIGQNDTNAGQFYCYGAGTGVTTGGSCKMFPAADHDSLVDYYGMSVTGAIWYIGPNDDYDSIYYNPTTDIWYFSGAAGVSIAGPLDQNEDVDIDFNANDEEFNLTTSATGASGYAADSAVGTVYGSGAGQNNNTYLWRLRWAANGDAQEHFLVCEDNDGTDRFSVNAGGVVAAAGSISTTAGATTAALAFGMGDTATEGSQLMVIDETVDLTAAGAKFVALTNTIPAGSVIVSVQGNIESAITAGGTSVTVSLGLNATDPDKYGTVNAGDSLSKNAKLDKMVAWSVLGAAEQIDVCACVTGGAALGDTNFSAGSVRVRVVYWQCNSLDDAA